jgi:hypothetical protein
MCLGVPRVDEFRLLWIPRQIDELLRRRGRTVLLWLECRFAGRRCSLHSDGLLEMDFWD